MKPLMTARMDRNEVDMLLAGTPRAAVELFDTLVVQVMQLELSLGAVLHADCALDSACAFGLVLEPTVAASKPNRRS